ncbi:hypothetical protein BLNAU_9317 [Blattamonas nauphoetae]|uniref:Uncharacterized protein n=1 Tax=Blattamonas nauphoetae TaxID=2049346 RepID=A0ABQ9XWD3_9EUKA|nr:hypothetical protein BLNAU_9317 [Blattamonas nauphoetae]
MRESRTDCSYSYKQGRSGKVASWLSYTDERFTRQTNPGSTDAPSSLSDSITRTSGVVCSSQVKRDGSAGYGGRAVSEAPNESAAHQKTVRQLADEAECRSSEWGWRADCPQSNPAGSGAERAKATPLQTTAKTQQICLLPFPAISRTVGTVDSIRSNCCPTRSKGDAVGDAGAGVSLQLRIVLIETAHLHQPLSVTSRIHQIVEYEVSSTAAFHSPATSKSCFHWHYIRRKALIRSPAEPQV